jgi:hypothetical protein
MSETFFSYKAYGLAIHSILPLPELIAEAVEAVTDVVVRTGCVEREPLSEPDSAGYVHIRSGADYYFWNDVGAFLVRGGREIVVEPAAGVEERTIRAYILGSAFGVLLHQRGLLALHASAVVADGGVVAFLGESGWGKSTTAAAMHALGHAVVADDVVALQVDDAERPMALPAFPRLKLYPETALSLGYEREALAVFDPDDDRREYRAIRGFPQEPLPLRRIYVLAEGESQETELLSAGEAFIELVRHTYALARLQSLGATPGHFRQCAQVANSVPIYRLKRQRSLAVLPGVARMVEEHLAHI